MIDDRSSCLQVLLPGRLYKPLFSGDLGSQKDLKPKWSITSTTQYTVLSLSTQPLRVHAQLWMLTRSRALGYMLFEQGP